MIHESTVVDTTPEWELDIRNREEEAYAAFLAADVQTLEQLWADDYAVNSPLQQVVEKRRLLELLQSGRIRHTTHKYEIEHIHRHGDVIVVMGRDRVTDPPDGMISHRRFTNVWQLEGGTWRSIARHAHVVSQEAAG